MRRGVRREWSNEGGEGGGMNGWKRGTNVRKQGMDVTEESH